MTETLKFTIYDYNEAIRPVANFRDRSSNNNGNYHTNIISKTTASSVQAYQSTIAELKKRLDAYNGVVQEDITMFDTLGADLETFDAEMAAAMALAPY